MVSRLNLSKKLLTVLLPLFLLAVGVSVYLTHYYQERQALEQMQGAAQSQASIIKESLVQMMITAQRVDESYLRRISQTRDVENINVWFFTDSLHLEDEFLSPTRLQRLRDRELKPTREQQSLTEDLFVNGEPQWLVQCELGKHTEGIVHVFSSGRPALLRSCERLKVILPFTADSRCLRCHAVDEGAVLGAAYMEMPLDKTVRALASNVERTIWIFGVFTLVALGIGAFLFRAFVSHPVKRLINATHIVGGGNLDHSIAPEFAPDEFGELAHSFDLMQDRLKENQAKLLHEERLSAVGRMASTIVHDLRSPLSTVLLAVGKVRRNGATGEEPILNIVQSSIFRINRMAQELLDFSRGELRLTRQEVNIPEFIESIGKELAPVFEQAHVQFLSSVGFKGNAYIDQDRLYRAIVNIINNAVDVLPNGGEIKLTVVRENDSIVFIVADNGPGIPKEIEDKVFDPFVTAGKAKGTGLGLAITKEIVELHQGSVSLESIPGKGTTFYVRIPLQENRVKSSHPASPELVATTH